MLVIAVLVGEVVCRLAGWGARQEVAQYISEWHDTPDGRTYWVVRGPGYNSDGMRDREHTLEKPPGAYRIICLGDSVTVGHGVKASENYPSVLEAFLKQLQTPAEVFNIAAPGWATHQQVAAYRLVARKYQPDQVFLGFCLNDVAEMQNNMLTPPSALISFLAQRSALIRTVVRPEARQVHRVEELMTENESSAVQAGWQLVFHDLLTLRDETALDQVNFSVLIFPFRFQVLPDAPKPLAQKRLQDFCFANNIPCMDLLPALARIGPDAFLDDSHLSPLGARTVAEQIIRWAVAGCARCGLDLTGIESSNCPHCGLPIDQQE